MLLVQKTVIIQEIDDTFTFEQVRLINLFNQCDDFYVSQSRSYQTTKSCWKSEYDKKYI